MIISVNQLIKLWGICREFPASEMKEELRNILNEIDTVNDRYHQNTVRRQKEAKQNELEARATKIYNYLKENEGVWLDYITICYHTGESINAVINSLDMLRYVMGYRNNLVCQTLGRRVHWKYVGD